MIDAVFNVMIIRLMSYIERSVMKRSLQLNFFAVVVSVALWIRLLLPWLVNVEVFK